MRKKAQDRWTKLTAANIFISGTFIKMNHTKEREYERIQIEITSKEYLNKKINHLKAKNNKRKELFT